MGGVSLLALVLAAIVVMAAGWLLGTTAGARWAFSQAAGRGLQVGRVDGRLAGPLVIDDVVYAVDGVRVEISHAELDWTPSELLQRQGHVRRLAAGRVRVVVRTGRSAAGPSSPPPTELPLALRFDAASIAELRIEVDDAAPQVLADVAFSGSWTGPELRVDQLALTSAPTGPLALRGRALLDAQGVDVAELLVNGPGEAQLRGRYAYAGDSTLDLSWKALRWPLQGEPQWRSDQGTAALRGTLQRYDAQVSAAVRWRDVAVDLEVEGSGTADAATVRRLRARAAQGEVSGAGEVAWRPQRRAHAQLAIRDLQPGRWLEQLDGRFNGALTVDGRWDEAPELAVDAQLRDSVWRGYAFRLDGGVDLHGEQWQARALQVLSGGTRLDLDGALWPQLDAQAQLASSDLASLWPGLSGEARASVRAQGTARQPRLAGEAHARTLAYGEISAQSLDATLSIDAQQRLDLRLQGSNVLAGRLVRRVQFDARGPLSAHDVHLLLEAGGTQLELQARGAADLPARRWSGELTAGRIGPRLLGAWELSRPAALELGERQRLAPACWRGDGARACFSFRREPARMEAELSLQDFKVDYLRGLLQPGTKIEGKLDASAQLAWTPRGLAALRAEVRTTALSAQITEQLALRFAPGYLRIAPDGERLRADLELPMADGGIKASARLEAAEVIAERPLSGQIDLRLQELTVLRLLTPEIGEVDGTALGRFQLGGTLAAPDVNGELQVTAPRLLLTTPNLLLTDLVARVRGGARGKLDVTGTAAAGGGHVRLDGAFDLAASPPALDVAVTGKDLQVTNTHEARVWASPDLKLTRDAAGLLLTGRVAIPRAEITPRQIGKGVSPSPDQVLVRNPAEQAQPGMKLRTEITLQLGDAVSFDGLGLKTRLTGALQLSDETGGVAHGQGQIELVGGQYKAYGQDLKVVTGRLIFDGGPVADPAVELKAERKPRQEITVGVTVRGRLERPEFALYSTPSMTQEQQLAWLVLGRPLQDSGTGQDRALVANAALSLGLSGSNALAQRLRGGLGLDEIAIGAEPGEASDQARITLGKYLSPRFYVAYGVGLFQPGHILRLRYDIGKGFKLQTETGVQSGGDLLYSVDR